MKILRNFIVLFLIFTVSGKNLWPQNFSFLNYGAESDLCDNFIYNITQDSSGYLWLGTGEGLCRFDGFTFTQQFPGDTLPESPVTCTFIDSKNRLWVGYDDGMLAFLQGIRFTRLELPEKNKGRINGIVETSEGDLIVATQNKGMILIGKGKKGNQFRELENGPEGQLISSLGITTEDDLLVGTFDGLFMYRFTSGQAALQLIGRFEDIPYSRVQTIKSSLIPNHYWIGTEDQGLYVLQTRGEDIHSYSISKTGAHFGLEYENVQDVYEEKNGNLWICTMGKGVYELLSSGSEFTRSLHFDKTSGFGSNFVSRIFSDKEGNLWFGTIGDGLFILKDQAFSFFDLDKAAYTNNILSLIQVDSLYWLGTGDGIMITVPGTDHYSYIGRRNGLPDDRITGLYSDPAGKVWIGTSGSGLFRMDKNVRRAKQIYLSGNSLENTVNMITGEKNMVWVATNGGVFNYNIKTGERKHFTTSEGLPHNKIRDIYVQDGGHVWIATRSNGLYNVISRDELAIDANAELEFVSITEDLDGDLWAGTNGDGVFHFSDDSLYYYSSRDGLKSNFCYSIATDMNGNIWTGHRLGISKIDPSTGNVRAFGSGDGIMTDFNYNAVTTSTENDLVYGTTNGLVIYDPSRDQKDTVPPQLNITSLKISDQEYDFTKPLYLPYGIYKIRIDFIGINFSSPEGVVYQYKLDGYDDWSEPTKIPYANYSRVEDGDYTFMLKACDENGVCTVHPLTLKINVKIPVWKAWWFILLVIIAVILTVYIIIKLRERKQKQIQEYLQRALDERTREVMEQKEEIENKNRDITDSINYAQRIQASILPPIKRLHDTFSGSFVFYQPRDIVSGDFYWYDRIWDNKFVIVCADSTGHGVPGAFMSMIGTTLIKDICSRPDVRSPSRILETLDKEIHEALNQNVEAEKSNDGMDIIVAEIDLNTRYLRVASAMRPIILYIGDEQVYVRGSRNSVGGHFEEEANDKEFRDEGFQLSKGDLIYMFSDGYPDQFGGPLGKKFKMVRLKNLLRDIHDKTMEDQYSYVKSNFMLWKEDLEQVDDVLFMGIRI